MRSQALFSQTRKLLPPSEHQQTATYAPTQLPTLPLMRSEPVGCLLQKDIAYRKYILFCLPPISR